MLRKPSRKVSTERSGRRQIEPLEPRLVLDAGSLIISEFVAINDASLVDQDGDSSDWIEIYNPTGERVDLLDWSLTDDDQNLTKWQFPDVHLDSGKYLVVFASGKNRLDPLQLHTNFSLDGGGEYLALVHPDGQTVAHEFAPEYPEQSADVSYGTTPDAAAFTLQSTGLKYLVPTPGDAAVGSSWMYPGFDDSGWDEFVLPPQVLVSEAGTGDDFVEIHNLSDQTIDTSGWVVAVNNASGTTPNINNMNTVLWELPDSMAPGEVLYRDDDSDGAYYWGENIFWRTATVGWVMIVNDTGEVVDFVVWGYTPDEIASLAVNVNGFDVSAAGVWSGDAVVGEGDTSYSLQRHGATDNDDRSDWSFVKPMSARGANAALRVPFAGHGVPGLGFETDPPGLGQAVQLDLQPAMQNVNASLWERIPFQVEELTGLNEMQLRMKYNDGFVAYINGQLVAQRNAPAWLQWNSRATDGRDAEASMVFEEFDLSAYLDVLEAGTNVLAIHGLNEDAADGNFLIEPELNVTAARFFELPTPWAPNGAGVRGYVGDTKFSVDRGFYDAPVNVEITTRTPGATIHYTLDGTWPTETYGIEYTGPITIDTTTTLRAIAWKEDHEPSDVDTQTYIFLEDVIHQPADPEGFPMTWGGASANYQMDPDVVNNARYSNTIKDDLRAVPTISLVTDPLHMFGPSGIYSNTTQHGVAWERPCSVEMFSGDGETLFQLNSGVRIQGGASRNVGNEKHSFRLLFKSDYGPTKLRYPLFGDEATDRFDTVTLRAGFNDLIIRGNFTLIQDRWAAQTQNEMGGYGPHGTFVHLYVNGLYWGLYNPVERPSAPFAAEYFGGDKDDYDAIVTRKFIDGNSTSWNQLRSLASQNPVNYAAMAELLDIPNFIDYMIINQYGGNWDWPHNNWYATHSREPGGKWRFHSWDAEGCLRDLGGNKVEPDRSWDNGPGEFYLALRETEEFRELFAEHLHRHFFNGGLLTPQANIERLNQMVAPIDRAIVGESARWGDGYDDTARAKTRDDDWLPRLDWLRNTYFQQRGATVLSQYQNAGLYPSTLAPTFNQPGGPVEADFELMMDAAAGQIYYTTDGSDPKAADGGISPNAEEFITATTTNLLIPRGSDWKFLDDGSDQGTAWRELTYDDDAWDSGPAELGYGDGDVVTTVGYIDADPETDGIQKNITTYFRHEFYLEDPPDFDDLIVRLVRDDGAVMYLNGHELPRSNMPGGPIDYQTHAGTDTGSETAFRTYEIDPDLLEQGENIVAVEIHQRGPTSSDISFNLELEASKTNTTIPISLTGATVVKARAIDDDEWSMTAEAQFFVGTMAAADNLAITEINYNPYDPTADELAVDETFVAGDFEFLELCNTSDEPVHLGLAEFVEGIAFSFLGDAAPQLQPNQRVVIVSNQAAFEARYGTGVHVAGQYEGQLDNNGEMLTLLDWQGESLWSFEYNDGGDWPGRADGSGASLELIDPAAVPLAEPLRTEYLEDGDSWRSSSEYGGSPGAAGTGPLGDVVINEVLSHTDPPLTDTIELHNTTGANINVSGWYLSDTNDDYRKFRIPNGTMIPGGGYVVFDEDDFNPTPANPAPNHFALDGAHGDDVWLMETDGSGELTRFVDHVEFGAAINAESFGRWPNGTGDLTPMLQRTLDPQHGANSDPRVGPLVISEIHYNPSDAPEADDLEFIEICNPTNLTVPLRNWRLRKGIDYNFAGDTVLGPRSVLVVVPFDLNDTDKLVAFRDAYGIDESVPLVGGYSGQLSDGGERVHLQRPDESPPDEPFFIPRLLEDEVRYDDQLPWPAEADGTGHSLNRSADDAWGNDGVNWHPAVPTPGSVSFLPTARVVGRHVFYNYSAFDGYNTGADAADNNAIAPDKQALLPGETATAANYTSYDAGINGIMIDVEDLPESTILGFDTFEFRVGNNDDPDTWAVAPNPRVITLWEGAGENGSDRVTLIWNDGLIVNQWLQVAMTLGGGGYVDVFCFGNAVGESGNSTADARVNAADLLLARNNPRTFLSPAPISFLYDYNRDQRVNATDLLIARTHQTHLLDALKLITAPGGKAAATQPDQPEPLSSALAWLPELQQSTPPKSASGEKTAGDEAVEKLLADGWV